MATVFQTHQAEVDQKKEFKRSDFQKSYMYR